ncbi:hypothetical protein N0O92_08605 [Alkalihalobacillus sp. MEB130]|uniref:hypothetical protein n=1 Tax=Alkalihalobacillus sp. MEB130 TaxID=2976704 RepID=UPI0028DDFAD0|nr:hypothetical protein [Alkalihalobacillus sp. MEB130]MDT8860293.1 hypothetical protein [Alkalihalobacillus sp. MEB130]
MTFVIPTWLDSILRVVWIILFIMLYSYIVSKVFEKLRIKANQWVIGIVVFLALLGTQFILEKQYKHFYPQEDHIVIKGNGEIVENATNKRLITTDNNLFIFIGGGVPFQDTISYSFNTKDEKIQDVEILLSFQEPDVEAIMKTFQVYKEEVKPDNRSLIDFFSSFIYYDDVIEEKFTFEVSKQIGMLNKEEISKEQIEEIIKTFESRVMDVHEKKLFSIELN